MGQRDPRIDAYIGKAAEFARPILVRLREVVHAACQDCEETVKWGMPTFTYNGKILCSMAAFKQHAAFNFWQGSMIVGKDGRTLDDAKGQFGRLAVLADLPGKRELTGYLREAMKLIDAGVKRPATRQQTPGLAADVPADLATALKKNAKALATFDAFPPGSRREYIEWITEAKREETRVKRLTQAIEWMAEGKRRNWKYENC